MVAALVFGDRSGRKFLFEGGVEDTIAWVGKPFDGSTVTSLAFSSEGFNNFNQVAFLAGLADGRSVEVVSQLPEPGAASLLVTCGALLMRLRSKFYRT